MADCGVNAVVRAFERRYGRRPTACWWAPGRVNLIGEHVDYCGGRVLPMPIQYGTAVAVAAADASRVRAVSETAPEEVSMSLEEGPRAFPDGHWGRFVAGAVAVLEREGAAPHGADVLVVGTVPGSGLASSASLSVALLAALGETWQRPLDGIALARAAQGIEREHVGVPCGLMDQAAVVFGEPGAALLFDCAAATATPIPLPAQSPVFVVADTGRSRVLAGSAYERRQDEAEAAAAALGLARPVLAHADAALLDDIVDERLRRRARHVISEHARVGAAVAAVAAGDWPRLGALLLASHASLRDDFEVSCPELDLLVDAFAAEDGCHGARMTGAGFGGSVVALVDAHAVDGALARVAASYRASSGLTLRAFVAESTGGVRRLG